MAATIQGILTTGDRDEIAASQRAYVEGRHTWTHVATRLLHAIASAPNRTHHTSTSSRRDIALITPVPPQASGIADYSMRLARALAEHVTVDLIPQRVPGDAGGPFDGIEMIDIREFLRRDERSSYFAAIYVMGNSAFHHYSLEAMQYRRGTVLLHEARYTGLFASYALERGSGIDWFTDLLASEYPGCAIGSGESPSYWDLANVGVYLCGPIVDRADRILTTSMFTADVVRLERPRRSPDVTCVGFGFPTLHTEYPRSGLAPFTVGTFGMQSEVKATDLVIEAFAEVRSRVCDARLIIAGETDFAYGRHLMEMVAKHHLQGAVSFLGRLSADDYWRAAASCNVGVQLRRATNGEVSAAVADLFALGVPVIVSDIGPNSDLPNDAVLKAAVQATPTELAHLIVDLHESPDRARSVAMRARVYAKEHDMAWAAAALLGTL
jgi:glycosyltransferase involved in cell wall biosynthesis